MRKGERGRPTLLNPEVTARICEHLAIGIAFKTACEAEGIREHTGHEWMRQGESGKAPYTAFFDAVTRARAKGEIHLHRKASEGGKGSHGAQFLLERRFRENYGNIQRIEHAGHDGGAVKIETQLAEMSDEELKKLATGGA